MKLFLNLKRANQTIWTLGQEKAKLQDTLYKQEKLNGDLISIIKKLSSAINKKENLLTVGREN